MLISDKTKKNLVDLKGIVWNDGTRGYNPKNLNIVRFGLNYDFIEKHHLTWINNLITGSGKNLADKSHKNHYYDHVQDYLRKYGVRKCEANAIVPMPDIARNFVEDSIRQFLGHDAKSRFEAKRQAIKTKMDKFRETSGIGQSLQSALAIIEQEP